MNRLLSTSLLTFSLLVIMPLSSFASSYPARIGGKIGNGIANVATGFVEIPKTIIVANSEQGPAYAATAGFVTGIVHTVGRTLCGAYDLVTFIIPTKPVVTPDYIWQDFDKETSYRSTWQFR